MPDHSPVTYTVICRPDGRVWAVRVEELPSIGTSVSQLSEARPRVRALIALVLGVPKDSFGLRVRVEAGCG